jgi:phage repressor protein C with HTH and peptisase S24 domain
MLYDKLVDTLQNLIKDSVTGKSAKISQQTIANILGVAQGAISQRIKTEKKFTLDELIKIERALGLPIGSVSGIQGNDNSVDLDFYPDVFGSCGTGLLVASETKEKITVPKANIKSYSENKKYSVITAKGESMQPSILDSDKLIIEHTDTIQDNKVYIFAYQENIYVKRLVKNISELVIISDNPDKEIYATQKITDFSSLRVIGQVIGLMREMV